MLFSPIFLTSTQFLQSLDEILFTNIDVTSTIFACVLINLARDREFQSSLREEILSLSHSPDVYVTNDETLLHFAYLEALRVNPFACEFVPSLPQVSQQSILTSITRVLDS